jgi:transcriptional regulator with XRE-family HTH domain
MPKNRNDCRRQKLRELLRRMRQDAGLRQVDLARRLRLPQSHVSKYESGERSLDLVEVADVCRALGVSLAEFVQQLEEAVHGS